MDVTSYDATGGSTILPTTAPTDGAMAFAWAYDGITATPVNQTTTTMSTSQSTSTSTPVSSAPSATSSAPSVLGFESLGVRIARHLFLLCIIWLLSSTTQ